MTTARGSDHTKAHSELIKAIRLALGRMPGVDFEVLHQTRPGRDERGNYIPAGGMVTGAADLIGHVFGRRVDLEVKTRSAKQTPEQEQWQRRIRRNGGVCEVVRSVEDALRVVLQVQSEVEPEFRERVSAQRGVRNA